MKILLAIPRGLGILKQEIGAKRSGKPKETMKNDRMDKITRLNALARPGVKRVLRLLDAGEIPTTHPVKFAQAMKTQPIKLP